MNTRRKKAAFGVVVVAVFAGVAAYLVFPALRPQRAQPVATGPAGEPIEWDVRPSAETLATDIGRVTAAVRERAAALEGVRLSGERLEGLESAVAESLEVYLTGSIERFERRLRDLGLPMPRNWEDESIRTSEWESRSKTLRWAPIASEGIDVRARFVEGEEVEQAESTPTDSAWRPERVAHLGSPEEEGLTIVEVVIPAQVRTLKDKAFAGRVGLWYAWNRADERWELYRIRIYDNTTGDWLLLPLL